MTNDVSKSEIIDWASMLSVVYGRITPTIHYLTHAYLLLRIKSFRIHVISDSPSSSSIV